MILGPSLSNPGMITAQLNKGAKEGITRDLRKVWYFWYVGLIEVEYYE